MTIFQALRQLETVDESVTKPYEILADLLDIILVFAERGEPPTLLYKSSRKALTADTRR